MKRLVLGLALAVFLVPQVTSAQVIPPSEPTNPNYGVWKRKNITEAYRFRGDRATFTLTYQRQNRRHVRCDWMVMVSRQTSPPTYPERIEGRRGSVDFTLRPGELRVVTKTVNDAWDADYYFADCYVDPVRQLGR